MSKSEFDQYLALLSGLLRLSPSQREAIASELRDHLEERLDELLAQGVPRQKAIETALEEFGDATGLASEFVQIFQRQRRRWMMRMTFGTAATIAAIALITSAFWPEGRPGPSPARVKAQAETTKRVPKRVPLFSPTLDDADLAAEANLKKRIDVEYVEESLADVLNDLEFNLELQFYVKVRYLEDIGISTDEPITIQLKDVSAEMALELILENLDLTYDIRDGIVLITTPEDFENIAEVRVYNCRDLLEDYVETFQGMSGSSVKEESADDPAAQQPTDQQNKSTSGKKRRAKVSSDGDQGGFFWNSPQALAQFGGGGMGGGGGVPVPQGPVSREEQLMNIITIAVMPESWEDMGGPGTIGEFDGMVVIRHNPRAHRQVEQVLHMLRDAASQQGWSNPDGRRERPSASGSGSPGGFF